MFYDNNISICAAEVAFSETQVLMKISPPTNTSGDSPSVAQLQKQHWNRRPPSINNMYGFMYALHRLHRTGPISPKSITGGLFCKKNPIKSNSNMGKFLKQECIPVGCVPSAAVAVSRGRVSAPGGGCLLGGGSVSVHGGRGGCGVCSRGVCSRGCLLLGGVYSQGGVSALGGCLLGGWYPSMH